MSREDQPAGLRRVVGNQKLLGGFGEEGICRCDESVDLGERKFFPNQTRGGKKALNGFEIGGGENGEFFFVVGCQDGGDTRRKAGR